MSATIEAPRLPLEKAERIAGGVLAALKPFCERLEIAGSIRRRRPWVGDIDLVVLPSCGANIVRILDRCALNATREKKGEQYVVFRLANGFQLDLWIAYPDYQEPGDLLGEVGPFQRCNFGVLLLARTGSAAFNCWIADQATARGCHFNPHRGIQANRSCWRVRQRKKFLRSSGSILFHRKGASDENQSKRGLCVLS